MATGPSARIADIAARWQFADSRHFSRPFRAACGTTPAVFLPSL
ncbi:AraC family transcriptional regulator [Actinomycetospora sp. C-140]